MKPSTRLIQLLIPLACIFNVSNAFNAPGEICQLCGQSQTHRNKIILFQRLPFLEKESSKVEGSSTKKQQEISPVKVEYSGEEMTETQKLMEQVKDSGVAGIISYALWEFGFWTISVPVCILGYYEVTGHWPDLSNADDQAKLGAEAFAFVNFARFAVPLRIGLALSTTPWIDKNIVRRFMKKDE